jgi:hypothetical protein
MNCQDIKSVNNFKGFNDYFVLRNLTIGKKFSNNLTNYWYKLNIKC